MKENKIIEIGKVKYIIIEESSNQEIVLEDLLLKIIGKYLKFHPANFESSCYNNYV